jgi:serine protease Do
MILSRKLLPYILTLMVCGLGLVASPGRAQTDSGKNLGSKARPTNPAQPNSRTALLQQFSDSLEALAEEVAPAVVQVTVVGYGPAEEGGGGAAAYVMRQHSLGSGVIVDPDGYIITNAHVVEGAQRVRVTLNRPAVSPTAGPGNNATFDAKIIGTHADTDLALLKIEATGLPFLPVDTTPTVRQGALVIALGSPEGLENTVTMGVVSSVARQADPDRAMVYIQTDAPINRGNSGGPLVDIDGHLVGINTFILSSSGGSEGLGFAIPASVVKFVYQRLRKQGHVDRSEIGAAAQSITATLAEGLKLPVDAGVVISDVLPEGPAESAGLKVGDIVLTVDGEPIDSLPVLQSSLYTHPTDEVMTMVVLRGAERVTLKIPVIQQKHEIDRLVELAAGERNLIGRLGLLGVDVDANVAGMFPYLRSRSGVMVVARTPYGAGVTPGILPGDVIRSLNTTRVNNLDKLRNAVRSLRIGDAVVLQIERDSKLEYVAFEFE